MVFLMVLLIVIVCILSIKVYQKLTLGICKSSVHMVGKVVIVTGGNCGIGLETAKDLAFRGARVILACKNVRRAEEARDEIVKATGNTAIICKQLDLASLKSVRQFCKDILKTEKRLDVLINNAGARGLNNRKTVDGLDIVMQVNYFALFLLTCSLISLMKSSAPSRIVNVSSMLHEYGELDFKNLNMETYWSESLVFANSKLCLNLMTLELSKRLEGTGVTVNALNPGIASTNLMENMPIAIIKRFVEKAVGFMLQNAWEAAQTSIYLAVSPEVSGVSGKYFSHCQEVNASKLSQDLEKAKRLWTESEKLVNFSLQ